MSKILNTVIAAKNKEGEFYSNPQNVPADALKLGWEDAEGKMCLWHSSAHIMAEAIITYYPNAKLTIGPPIDQGFYYDVDFGSDTFHVDDIPKIEQTFMVIATRNLKFVKEVVDKPKALIFFEGNNYKVELINGLGEDEEITLYHSGTFTDLCKGPHILCTSEIIMSFKILNIAGSYWKGNSANTQLTRIYAISFPSKELMQEYLNLQEQLKKYDHRVIGQGMKLFCFSEKVGKGLPLWLPNGFEIRQALQNEMMQIQKKEGYKYVMTPHLARTELYKTSGHYEKYRDSSFSEFTTPERDESFMLKPMNCPHHSEIFKAFPKSYRELPLRLAENGNVSRYEPSGSLHGMSRVRCFCQDDAHIFCTQDQLGNEIGDVINLTRKVFKRLGFEKYTAQISVRDYSDLSKYIGSKEDWDTAENDLIIAAQKFGLDFEIVEGEAAFYGPKIDISLNDSLDRSWQLSTIQVDYQLPDRFELEYIGPDNKKHRPVMIHRAIFGSYERLMSILLEHYKGVLPLWLAPVQICIATINDECIEFSKKIESHFLELGYRVEIDITHERLAKKILNAEHANIPYIIVLGNKEVELQTISVRSKAEKWQRQFALEAFVAYIKNEMEQGK
jgi:threonyl-tRNA synthetase